MQKLSLCMIVKNEESTLDRCLKSAIKVVDEIIIVDTGSTDKTKLIAKKYTDKIYDFKWCDDFSKARNFAFKKASCEYIMWLDADDVVPPKTAKFILNNKASFDADTYMLKYEMNFIKRTPQFSYYRERIVKNCKSAEWKGCVHECITPFGKVEHLNYPIYHKKQHYEHSDRNLKIYESTIKERNLNTREEYYYGRELFDHEKYKKCIKTLTHFIDSGLGWVENVIDACYIVARCYHYLGNNDLYLEYLFKTFKYDSPRANICCMIGDYFLINKNYILAKCWYLMTKTCTDVSQKGGFVEKTYYKYYPYLQLSVCYFNLGDYVNAYRYNHLASKIQNNDITKNNEQILLNYIKK